ncbi:phage portal protein [Novosphingobium sp.]|uniref:phage portal protein n=1 Tax=Novosphingobium sp. TaxID=1874826 RepID=UPI003D6D81E6
MSWWSRAAQWFMAGLTARDDDLYRALGGMPSHTDEVVNSSSVLGLSAAWGCVNLLAGTISSLSMNVQVSEGGVKRPAPDHPLQGVLDDPNADQTPIDFWEQISLGLELWGNAYARVDKRSDGSIISLTPIRPDIMQVERARSGALRYRWYDEGRHDEDEANVLHIRGIGGDALGGMSPLTWARNTFGTAQAIERAAGRTFANGVRPSGVLSIAHALDGKQRAEAEALLQDKFAGAMHAGRPMLLDNGMQWQQITFNPEDAQMLESRGFSVEEICRIFGVPPFMVGHTEKVTSFGSGLEQQILGFQKFTLRKRLKKIEQAVRKQLMTPEDRRAGYAVAFNLEDLLRGDSKARAAFYRSLLDAGVITINEVRALEGLAPIAGGDVPRMQKQNVPITDVEAIGHNGGPPLEEGE